MVVMSHLYSHHPQPEPGLATVTETPTELIQKHGGLFVLKSVIAHQ